MNILGYRKSQPLYYFILILLIVVVLDLGLRIFNIQESRVFDTLKYIVSLDSCIVLILSIRQRDTVNFFQMLFLIWIGYLLITAIPELTNPERNYIHLKLYLSKYLILFLVPFMMIIKPDLEFYRLLLRCSYVSLMIYMIFGIPLFLIDINNYHINESFTLLLEGGILLLMTYPYHSKKYRIFTIVAVIIGVVLMMLLLRRNKVVFFGGGLFLAILNYLFFSTDKKKVVVFLCLIGGLLVFYLFSGNFNDFFGRVSEGMSSREYIIDRFYSDFDSTPNDWITGRGILGQFDGGVNNDDITGMRDGIENGYLYWILKGGWIFLGLLMIISVQSIYRGLFKSKNVFCKGAAFILILYYLDMIGFGIPTISLKYFIVFISIANCNCKWLRECSDEELSNKIGLK